MPNGLELPKYPPLFGGRSPTFRQVPLAQHPVGATRSGVGCVGSGRGIPDRYLIFPTLSYNQVTYFGSIPREAHYQVRSAAANGYAALFLQMEQAINE